MNPFDLMAGPFLALYVLLFGVSLVFGLYARGGEPTPPPPADPSGLDPIELAWLAGGQGRALDTALVGLMEIGGARVDLKSRTIAPDPPRAASPPYLARFQALLPRPTTLPVLARRMAPAIEAVFESLVARGLVLTRAQSLRLGWQSAGPMFLLGLFGVIRIVLGAERHRPVGYILTLTLVTLFVAQVLLARRPRVRRAGREALRARKGGSARLMRAPAQGELLFALALGGGAVLGGTPYADFTRLKQATSGGGDGGGGDGGGGGGGGGGCGGCGH
jgi:uncharacterized protein (TIGR04222 family)